MKGKKDWTTILIALIVLIALGNLIYQNHESKREAAKTVTEERTTFDPYRMSRFDDLSEHIAGVTEAVRATKPDAMLTDVRWNEDESRYELCFETSTSATVEYILVR